jgi:hypothetical protein
MRESYTKLVYIHVIWQLHFRASGTLYVQDLTTYMPMEDS